VFVLQYFQWADETRRDGGGSEGCRKKIHNAQMLNTYMRGSDLHFYGETQFVKRMKENINRYFKAPVSF